MKYYVIDSFAEHPFEGNPAGVCIMEKWITDELMQQIAEENNLSETAFAVKEGDDYKLRWFTPGREINLCGHATLATGYVIMNYIDQQTNGVKFHTMSGTVTVQRLEEDLYELDFPTDTFEKVELTQDMIEAIGVKPLESYLSGDLMFVLESEEEVRKVQPDFLKLERLAEGLGVYITAKGEEFDFVSRAFFPKVKINEDPVCGSMHCTLIPYWAERLGKNELLARQVSRRGGTLYCRLEGKRVKIAGKARTYLVGDIYIE